MSKRLDFVVVGAQRSGTTWLYEMLKQHPEVSLGDKEINFFNDRNSSYVNDPVNNYGKGIGWYLDQLVEKQGTLIGDVSANYLFDPVAGKRLHDAFPNAKVVAILRDPVKRALSQYRMASQYFFLGADFSEAARKHPDILERGLYAKQLEEYFRLFGSEQVHVIKFDQIKSSPETVLKGLERFLGIQEFIPPQPRSKVNQSQQVRSKRFARLVGWMRRIKSTVFGQWLWRQTLFRWFASHLSRVIRAVNTTRGGRPQVSSDERKRLREYYAQDLARLSDLVDFDVSDWR